MKVNMVIRTRFLSTMPEVINEVCRSYIGNRYSKRQFRIKFGTSQYMCGLSWNTMVQSNYDLSKNKVKIKDLLKCMHFLYSTYFHNCLVLYLFNSTNII